MGGNVKDMYHSPICSPRWFLRNISYIQGRSEYFLIIGCFLLHFLCIWVDNVGVFIL